MLSSLDLRRITKLLIHTSMMGKLPALEEKLHQFKIVDPEDVPENLITMNSEVVVDDLTTSERQNLRLVYQLSPLYFNQASILAPIGTTLLGMKLHETQTYRLRDGTPRTIKIVDILFQPEANKQFDL